MSNPRISDAARMLVSRRARRYGHKGLKKVAAKASATKVELYGELWNVRIRQGKKLVPLTNQPPQESE